MLAGQLEQLWEAFGEESGEERETVLRDSIIKEPLHRLDLDTQTVAPTLAYPCTTSRFVQVGGERTVRDARSLWN